MPRAFIAAHCYCGCAQAWDIPGQPVKFEDWGPLKEEGSKPPSTLTSYEQWSTEIQPDERTAQQAIELLDAETQTEETSSHIPRSPPTITEGLMNIAEQLKQHLNR